MTMLIRLWLIVIIGCLALAYLSGCSINNPKFVRETHHTNGVVEIERMSIPSIAAWPATTELSRQRASMTSKSFTVGTDGLREETASTNGVEYLRELNKLVNSIPH